MKEGDEVIYYPAKKNAEDNRHFLAKVREVGKRIKITYFSDEKPDGCNVSVAAWRIEERQRSLL